MGERLLEGLQGPAETSLIVPQRSSRRPSSAYSVPRPIRVNRKLTIFGKAFATAAAHNRATFGFCRHPMDALPDMSASSDPYILASLEERCAVHTKLTIPSKLRIPGARAFHTHIRDISLAGFCAAAPRPMYKGQTCWLTVPSLEPMQATVVWWEKAQVGCAFTTLLSPALYDSLLERFARTTPI